MNLALEPDLMPYYFGRLAEYYIHANLPPERIIAIHEAAAEFH